MNREETIRVARSFLFVPGDRPERFDKAIRSGTDVVVLDLEDAVADEHKDSARREVVDWLSRGGPACVRVASPAGQHFWDDVAALKGLPGLIAVMVPKAESPDELSVVAERVGVPVIALVESALGMVRAQSLATAPGVSRIAFGHLDYALDLGCDTGRTAMLQARSALVLASRAARLPGPIDGVTAALDDAAALDEDLRCAKELGMTGKLLVHPRQVVGTHAAFRPDAAAVRWARRVVESKAEGKAVRIEGQMVDAPVVAWARAILRDVR
ncbi:HpcH/HpaI aldolase/citrate lyase family protein [Nocardia sp. NPDC050412]|uniref:HpcH/HpaI aldolase/citrate lyase family protein n=1 Tax=Nocardia sp. NPDC050412 TaxID=3364320 RepID=UPI0037ABCE44